QILHVHYQGKKLSILDSDDTTFIYTVKIPSQGMKLSLSHSINSAPPPYSPTSEEPIKPTAPIATATFAALSTSVSLTIHSLQITLQREKNFNRTYVFINSHGVPLRWENDGMLSGDWKLVDVKSNEVKARFRNKVFSSSELGTFEVMGCEEEERDLIVVSGLAVLVMVQSTVLAALVLTGGE
ncbi:hypothetical protein N431DRAFT_316347, partial [Stipitochalara longipes BDJ]